MPQVPLEDRSRRRARTYFFRSLSLRLFVWLGAVFLVAFTLHAWISMRTSTEEWNRTVLASTARASDLILRSTHYHMLLNRKEDVHQIIRTVAGQPGVEGVRIYDKQGVIIDSAAEAEIGRRVDPQAEACVICHDRSEPLRSVPTDQRSRVYSGPDGGRVAALISPIVNAPECSAAPCHAHPAEQTILGVLDVKMSLAEADAHMARARRGVILWGGLTALLVGAAAAGFLVRGVSRPVRRLIAGTERVAAGDLTTEIECGAGDEMGRLARAFNRMTRDLRQAHDELTAWSGRLEARLAEKTAELGRTQRHVAHMEKMASLGKLSATVAHELNNPLTGIRNYARLVERTLAAPAGTIDAREELRRYASVIQKEAGRCGDIVRNLLLFARPGGIEMARVALGPIVERALMLVRHHLEMADVRLERDLAAGDDELVCDADQVQQALIALLINAVEAMPDGGVLTVRSRVDATHVRIEVQDTGRGIPSEVLAHVFEPFFTTKEHDAGGGVGLGLAVVYGIAQRHGGGVTVESEPGRGARFALVLPRVPDPRRSHERETDATVRDECRC